MKKKIGFIGFGTIGKYICENLIIDGAEVAFIYKREPLNDPEYDHLLITSKEELEAHCKQGVDLVIEAATSQAVIELSPILLQYTDMAVFSSTAFAVENFHHLALNLCQTHNHKIFIPHGAVVGYDGIMDAKQVLQEVTITTTKSPSSLGRSDTQTTVVYEGPTRGACQLYTRNVNVHAGAALAGLGFDKTLSKIISDPTASGNNHVIEVKANNFQFKIEVTSVSAGGVTSASTPVSAYSSIKRILSSEGIVLL